MLRGLRDGVRQRLEEEWAVGYGKRVGVMVWISHCEIENWLSYC